MSTNIMTYVHKMSKLQRRNSERVATGMAIRRSVNLPASTWLGVQSLAKEGFLIEVDAIAVVSK